MLSLTLCKNTSPDNAVTKNIVAALSGIEIVIKDKQNWNNLVIPLKVSEDDLTGINYAVITGMFDGIDRSYFVNNISVTPNGVFELSLKLDVLETYKNLILEMDVTCIETSTYNPLNSTNKYDYLLSKTIEKKSIPFDSGVTDVLTVTLGDVRSNA